MNQDVLQVGRCGTNTKGKPIRTFWVKAPQRWVPIQFTVDNGADTSLITQDTVEKLEGIVIGPKGARETTVDGTKLRGH